MERQDNPEEESKPEDYVQPSGIEPAEPAEADEPERDAEEETEFWKPSDANPEKEWAGRIRQVFGEVAQGGF